jgi:hypothetical protein
VLASIYHGISLSLVPFGHASVSIIDLKNIDVSVWFLSKTTNQTPFFFLLKFQAAVSAFRLQMELFKLKQRPLAFVGSPKDPLLVTASGIAKDCELMVEFLLAKVPVHPDILKVRTLTQERFCFGPIL